VHEQLRNKPAARIRGGAPEKHSAEAAPPVLGTKRIVRARRSGLGYKSWIPRIALGSTAAAMAAITIGSLVVLPATFDHMSVALSALAVVRHNGFLSVRGGLAMGGENLELRSKKVRPASR